MEVVGATIGGVCVVIAAVVTNIGQQRTRREVRGIREDVATNHGKRPGEYLELIHAEVSELRMMVVDHITDREAHAVAEPPRRRRKG